MPVKSSVNERVAVLETKLDDIKEDVTTMRKENRLDHDRVMDKLEALEGYRNWLMGAVAIISPALIIAANHYFK